MIRFLFKFLFLPILSLWIVQWMFTQGILNIRINKTALDKTARQQVSQISKNVGNFMFDREEGVKTLPLESQKGKTAANLNENSADGEWIELCEEINGLSKSAIELRKKLLQHFASSTKK